MGTPPHRRSQLLLCTLLALTASALSAPTSAQTRPADQTIAPQPQEPRTPPALSAASLERIRRALALEGQPRPSGLEGLDIVEEVRLGDQRPFRQIVPGFAFVGGWNRFSFADATAGPVPMGGPTHRTMMSIMTPRAMREATGSDVLGIATVSAFSLVPYAVKALSAIAGWLFGDDESGGPQYPIMTDSEETVALEDVRADDRIFAAGVRQRGRTVGLSLVVAADTPPETARALGKRFIMLVKTLASAEPDPDHDVGTGNYDYIVRVSSPTEHVIALGGKATSRTSINW